MQSTMYISCTPFRLNESEGVENSIHELIQDVMDGYQLDFQEIDGRPGFFVIDHLDTFDGGDSVGERLVVLANRLTPYVASPFMLTLRDCDDPSDERDQDVYGGPTSESIDRFKRQQAYEQALHLLDAAPGLDSVAQALQVSYAAGLKPVSVEIDGVFCEFQAESAEHAIELAWRAAPMAAAVEFVNAAEDHSSASEMNADSP